MIDYNFYGLFKSIDDLCGCVREDEDSTKVQSICDSIKAELNKFFGEGFRCREVIYTNNFDKPMFGAVVRPLGITGESLVYRFFQNEHPFEPFRFEDYQLELDSKIFTNTSLTAPEIASIIIHDINAMSGTKITEDFRNAVDAIVVFSDKPVHYDTVKATSGIFSLVVEITMRNLTSIFCKSYVELEEKNIPDIIAGYNLVDPFTKALSKLMNMCTLKNDTEYPTILLTWYLNIKDLRPESRYYSGVLRKAMQYEGSTLIKRAIELALNKIAVLSPTEQRNLRAVTESKRGLIYQMKRNGLKSIEEDLYEYGMRLRNVETQDDALLLMRQINSRMGILEDYLREDDIDEKDRQRWEKCYEGYLKIREELSKKTVYNRKMYGLFVDYNALQNMSQTGQLMNTYY